MFNDATATPVEDLSLILFFHCTACGSAQRTAEPIRAYQRFEMIDIASDTIRKTGRTPYF